MELETVIKQQIGAAIQALARVQEKLIHAETDAPEDILREMNSHLGTAAFHIADVQFNCATLLAGERRSTPPG
ncbi:MAG: hypothetical protein COW56_14425 [Rhodocyclales bacterium CG17_big_fil_post_rev_8_21_14_2_50_68_7]|nr:MAG: hypothetical protein AUK49_09460 [Betaproteobacteria bacterium CG2_30_68_42]PIV71520.1 MAG: hypothetical protein COW56_14425 [Rhodocyclales bacterium CG17_big_fil_post_rev_8_21_14_2_50_68_7]PIX75102.1 MAG: hypothetical protein COZ38_07385 [Rhodocyclales bacterium CG_4_10_14_3_um_filter_68_10]